MHKDAATWSLLNEDLLELKVDGGTRRLHTYTHYVTNGHDSILRVICFELGQPAFIDIKYMPDVDASRLVSQV